MNSRKWLAAAALAMAILSRPLGLDRATPAQGNKAAISGKVTDSNGGILQGAEIVLEPDRRARSFQCSRRVFH